MPRILAAAAGKVALLRTIDSFFGKSKNNNNRPSQPSPSKSPLLQPAAALTPALIIAIPSEFLAHQFALGGLELSQPKITTLLALSFRFSTIQCHDDTLNSLPDAQIQGSDFTLVKGITPSMCDWAVIDALARADELPRHDSSLNSLFEDHYGIERGKKDAGSEHERLRAAEKWRPYRSVALLVRKYYTPTPSPTATLKF